MNALLALAVCIHFGGPVDTAPTPTLAQLLETVATDTAASRAVEEARTR